MRVKRLAVNSCCENADICFNVHMRQSSHNCEKHLLVCCLLLQCTIHACLAVCMVDA